MEFGNYDCWKWFNDEFSCFVKKQPRLEGLRDKLFVGKFHPKHHADYVIFGLAEYVLRTSSRF